MASMTERASLDARYTDMKAKGLVDVKFLLGNPAEATREELCREVNAMYDALDRGESKLLDFGDRTAEIA
jgi:hypothetical protein